MLIYVSFILNLYLGILHYMYTKSAKYHKESEVDVPMSAKKNIDTNETNFL